MTNINLSNRGKGLLLIIQHKYLNMHKDLHEYSRELRPIIDNSAALGIFRSVIHA